MNCNQINPIGGELSEAQQIDVGNYLRLLNSMLVTNECNITESSFTFHDSRLHRSRSENIKTPTSFASIVEATRINSSKTKNQSRLAKFEQFSG